MRINAGKCKGYPILTQDIAGTRPTSDKVKQAMFNVIGPVVEGKTVLDLYAGFGSLGLEALSRGASKAVFVESNAACCRVLRENIRKIAVGAPEAAAELLECDVFRAIARLEKEGQKFSIILSDAPYQDLAHSKLLNALANSAILEPSGLLLMQHSVAEKPMTEDAIFKLLRAYRYGATMVSLYRRGT